MIKRVLFHRLSGVISILIVSIIVVVTILPSSAAPTFTEYATPGSPTTPMHLLNGPDGYIWYVDYGDWLGYGHPGPFSVKRLNPANGSVVSSWALPAQTAPMALIIGSDGNVWIAGNLNFTLFKVTPSGTITQYDMTGPVFNDPDNPNDAFYVDMTIGPDGNIWMSVFNTGQIAVINMQGQLVRNYSVEDVAPLSIVKGPDNKLYYTSNLNQIGVMDPCSGAITSYPFSTGSGSNYSMANSLTVGSDGNLWFTMVPTHQIGKFNVTTHAITLYTDGTTNPISLVTGPDGNLWAAQQSNQQLAAINPANGSITHYGTPSAGGPDSVIVGPDNNIWYSVHTYLTTNLPGKIGKANIGLSGGSAGQTPTANPNYCPAPQEPSGGSSGGNNSGGGSTTPSPQPGSPKPGCPTVPSSERSASECGTQSPVIKTTVRPDKIVIQQHADGSTTATVPADLTVTTDYSVPTKQTLYIEGSIGNVTAQSGAVIKGNGKAGKLHVDAGAYLSPGHSPGCLTTKGLTLLGTYTVQLGGAAPCSGYDQVSTSGPVSLSGKLDLSLLPDFSPFVGQQFTIIKNESKAAISGQFTGLNEGDTVSSQGVTYAITYKGNNANDVVLSVQSINDDFAAVRNAAKPTQPTMTGVLMKYFLPALLLASLAGLVVCLIIFIRDYRKSYGRS